MLGFSDNSPNFDSFPILPHGVLFGVLGDSLQTRLGQRQLWHKPFSGAYLGHGQGFNLNASLHSVQHRPRVTLDGSA